MRNRQGTTHSSFLNHHPTIEDPDEIFEPNNNGVVVYSYTTTKSNRRKIFHNDGGKRNKHSKHWTNPRVQKCCYKTMSFFIMMVCVVVVVTIIVLSITNNMSFDNHFPKTTTKPLSFTMKKVMEIKNKQQQNISVEHDGRGIHVKLQQQQQQDEHMEKEEEVNELDHEYDQEIQKDKNLKYILFYNSYWNILDYQFGIGNQPFLDYHCPISNCFTSNDPSLFDWKNKAHSLSQFDAILIHAPEFVRQAVPYIQTWRQSFQRFVFMNMESPQSYQTPTWGLEHFYNWTMTYRYDSDIIRPYGYFSPKNEHQSLMSSLQSPPDNHFQWKPYDEREFFHNVLPRKGPEFYQLADRPNKVAWIVSRCYSPSHREQYVTKLQEYIQVDIFGGCSNNRPCNYAQANHLHDDDNCTMLMKEKYKFYLSFENSFCHDYVTEKFFRRISENMLVIVLGGEGKDNTTTSTFYNQIAPPHSHLNVFDYESPKALAETLHMLDQNVSAYLSYFWWKDHYTVQDGRNDADHAHAMCQLCEMLHDPTLPSKVYPDIEHWYGEQSQCQQDLPQIIQDLGPSFGNDPDSNDGPLSNWDDFYFHEDNENPTQQGEI